MGCEPAAKAKRLNTLDMKIVSCMLDDDDGGEVDKREVMQAILKDEDVRDFMCQIPQLEPMLDPRTFGAALDAIDRDKGGTLDLDEFRQMCGIAPDLAQSLLPCTRMMRTMSGMKRRLRPLQQLWRRLWRKKLNSAHREARERMKGGDPGERLNAVMELFDECDENAKEYLEPIEFAQLTANLGIVLSGDELEDAVAQIDADGNGQIEVDEYLEWWGDTELIELYEERMEAIENGKPYRMMASLIEISHQQIGWISF